MTLIVVFSLLPSHAPALKESLAVDVLIPSFGVVAFPRDELDPNFTQALAPPSFSKVQLALLSVPMVAVNRRY